MPCTYRAGIIKKDSGYPNIAHRQAKSRPDRAAGLT